MKILIMNGINLYMLGIRNPKEYGTKSLDDILAPIVADARAKGIEVDTFVTNFEGEFVEKLYACRGAYDGIVMNCGAWSHYSYGIRDAVEGCGVPAVDVHISNVYEREEFRKTMVIAPVCIGQVYGLGEDSYRVGLEKLISYLGEKQ